MKDTDEYFDGTPKNLKLIYSNDFEDDTTATDPKAISGRHSFYFHPGLDYGPIMKTPFRPRATWLRASAKLRVLGYEGEDWKMLQFIAEFQKDGKKLKQNMVRVNRLVNQWQTGQVSFDTVIPAEPFDSVQVIFWNPGSNIGYKIDDVKLYTFDE